MEKEKKNKKKNRSALLLSILAQPNLTAADY